MHVTKEGIETIKAGNSLADIVTERGITLKRKGQTLVASCPFHEEKTPSFTVTPTKGLFHCFGCGVAGDVIGFVTRHDGVSFTDAMEGLARRAGLDMSKLMEARPTLKRQVPVEARTPPPVSTSAPEILSKVVEHYHQTFCEREDAQAYLIKRGITDTDLLQALKVGYADGSLLKLAPRHSPLREELRRLGIITATGRELLGGCLVVPIPDPITGTWANLYGRGLKASRHCYLPGHFRGVLNFQAARSCSEVILTESILDALSFHQAGLSAAIPLYGTNGFTSDHLDLLKRERVERVILALDNDAVGRKATEALKGRLTDAGLAVRVTSFPKGIKDANELLVSRNGDASEAFVRLMAEAEPKPAPDPPRESKSVLPLSEKPARTDELVLEREGVTYTARIHGNLLGRLRATVKASRGEAFHVDTIDLYASRSRSEFSKRTSKTLNADADIVERTLLALVVEAEKLGEDTAAPDVPEVQAMTDAERAEALAFLKRPDLLDQIGRDIDALGFVGEETNKRLLYLIAISRKLDGPLSAIVLSQSGAGKSGLTDVIERLCPPEDVVLLTRLTPQSLYYVEDDFLNQKLVIIEERHGSVEADYSIRVLQSRKKLIAAAPVKDPQTGNMKTKIFTVEARAAFVEATTAGAVNHENATRCFELMMDETQEQTRRIHERQRLMKTERGLELQEKADRIARLHWNAQRLLEPARVVIPFADLLTFPVSWMRTRRDHARFLNLIEVSAFLHQYQRERRSGAIVATVDDYAVAYGLAAEVLAETLSDLRKPLRDAYGRICELSQADEGSISRRQIREALSLPDSTVRHWLSELVELEYLEVEASKGGAGKGTRYRLTARGPREQLVLGLLSPKELRAKIRNAGGGGA
jgi:DNA primase catalytic core